jgi:hypothetical protein
MGNQENYTFSRDLKKMTALINNYGMRKHKISKIKPSLKKRNIRGRLEAPGVSINGEEAPIGQEVKLAPVQIWPFLWNRKAIPGHPARRIVNILTTPFQQYLELQQRK